MWVAVSRAEAKAVKLERQGEVEEAKELRAQANSMRYEDPYTTLQDQLDEAVKNEVNLFTQGTDHDVDLLDPKSLSEVSCRGYVSCTCFHVVS